MYIEMFGDPKPGQGIPSKDQVRLEDAMSPEQLDDLKKRFKALPRALFDSFMDKLFQDYQPTAGLPLATLQMIQQRIEDTTVQQRITEDLRNVEKKTIYALFLDLFNEVNEAEQLTRGIADPWEWEIQKASMFYTAQAEGNLRATNPEFFLDNGQGLDQDKFILRQGLEQRAVKVGEKIADQAYKIQFLASINMLLDQEQFDACNLIIATYEGLPSDAWAAAQNIFK